jgi:hypothetical protein
MCHSQVRPVMFVREDFRRLRFVKRPWSRLTDSVTSTAATLRASACCYTSVFVYLPFGHSCTSTREAAHEFT